MDENLRIAEQLALVVADYVHQEAELERKVTELQGELGAVRAAKAETLRRLVSGGDTPKRNNGEGAKERVFRLIASHPGRIFGTAEVASELGLAPNVASVYLSELLRELRLVRLTKGRYRLMQPKDLPPSAAANENEGGETDDPW